MYDVGIGAPVFGYPCSGIGLVCEGWLSGLIWVMTYFFPLLWSCFGFFSRWLAGVVEERVVGGVSLSLALMAGFAFRGGFSCHSALLFLPVAVCLVKDCHLSLLSGNSPCFH